jgi:maltose alpha-D-glucosyltransferase/alpha-amylase
MAEVPEPRPMQAEQSNTSVVFGDRLVLKLYRRLGEGLNPDLEIGRFLTDRAGFEHIAPVAGGLELRTGRGPGTTLGILHRFVPNEGDAWSYTEDRIRGYLEAALARAASNPDEEVPASSLFAVAEDGPSDLAAELMEDYLESARLLGRRTAEMHRALASDPEDPAFAPERVTPFYQRSLYQSLRAGANGVFQLLRARASLPHVDRVLRREGDVFDRFRAVLGTRVTGARIRIHGDFHLGQVLYTGRDFVIIDFEGEPARPVGERRIKRLPLVDVARMIRSFHYAPNAAALTGGLVEPGREDALAPWVRLWYESAAGAYLREYLDGVDGAPFHARSPEEVRVLLEAFLLEKALYEVAYEANNRPDWLPIPIAGIDELLEVPA